MSSFFFIKEAKIQWRINCIQRKIQGPTPPYSNIGYSVLFVIITKLVCFCSQWLAKLLVPAVCFPGSCTNCGSAWNISQNSSTLGICCKMDYGFSSMSVRYWLQDHPSPHFICMAQIKKISQQWMAKPVRQKGKMAGPSHKVLTYVDL